MKTFLIEGTLEVKGYSKEDVLKKYTIVKSLESKRVIKKRIELHIVEL